MVMVGALRALAYLEEQLSKLTMEAQFSDLSGVRGVLREALDISDHGA